MIIPNFQGCVFSDSNNARRPFGKDHLPVVGQSLPDMPVQQQWNRKYFLNLTPPKQQKEALSSSDVTGPPHDYYKEQDRK